MLPARRGIERKMTAIRTRRATRRPARARKAAVAHRRVVKGAVKPLVKPVGKTSTKLGPPPQVLFRLCRAGWSVIVDKIANAQGTRFVCPFCPVSHRVPGPVRGFRKMRRAQWVKLRRVEE
jgi:hypothetical protein